MVKQTKQNKQTNKHTNKKLGKFQAMPLSKDIKTFVVTIVQNGFSKDTVLQSLDVLMIGLVALFSFISFIQTIFSIM